MIRRPTYERLSARLRADRPVALATVIDGEHGGAELLVEPDGRCLGTLGDPELDRAACRDALVAIESGRSETHRYGPGGSSVPEDLDVQAVTVFIQSWSAPPQMWVFGAADFTAALCRVAKVLAYRVLVCDARDVFVTRARFPIADELVVSWPGALFEARGEELGPADAVCVLTHDAKFDVPAIAGALRTGVGYIGVMGSRRTQADRRRRLAEAGIDSAADLDRLMAPIGLDIGARTPEETAVSICAEIVARRNGRHLASLRDGTGPIRR